MALRPSVRWSVFRRDGFRCRYCGRDARDKDVVLEVDHVAPRAGGGLDDVANLATSCRDCNSGKSDNPIDAKRRRRRRAKVVPKVVAAPEIQEHYWCPTRLQIAILAYQAGESYASIRRRKAQGGEPVPPGRGDDATWPALVTDDNQRQLVNVIGWIHRRDWHTALSWPVPETPAST